MFMCLKTHRYIKVLRIAEIGTMNYWWVYFGFSLAFHNTLTGVYADFVSRNTLSLIRSFLYENKISFAVVINCRTAEDIRIMKFFSDKSIRIKVQTKCDAVEASSLLSVDNHKLGVVLDWQCSDSTRFLTQASEQKLYSKLHHWLILRFYENSGRTVKLNGDTIAQLRNNTHVTQSDDTLISTKERSRSTPHEDALIAALEPLDLPLDSQVTVTRPGADVNQVLLQDIYRIKSGLPLIFTPLCDWAPGQPFPFSLRRDNYGGIVLNTATVVIGDTWENFLNWRYKHINSLTKFHYILVEHLSRMLNFRTNVTPVNSWGFPVNNTANYDGVIGLLQRGEIEVSSVGLLHKTARMDIVDYAGETVCYEGAFLFLKPSLSDVSNIYTLPFSRAVWVTYLVAMAVFSYALYVTQRAESGLDESQGTQPLSLSDSLLTVVGIICQEGTTRDPQRISSRIILLSLLLLSLFLTTSYSAIIVSLLQTTSTAINSLKDLMNSPFTLAMNDVATSINYVNETTDADIKNLYFKHLFTQPYHKAFTTSEVGVEKMREGLYAFHGDADAFKIISETYEEHEKCRLKNIKMFSTIQLALVVQKGSPFKEHIRQRARWLKESGISDREYKYWIVQKPKCHGNVEGFKSVRLQDFYPALLVFAYGLVLSVGTLVSEVLYQKLQCLKYSQH
ncbi:hypothetical protein L798_10082 [Zootermopsis nevadensis]|uniref:Uncharacterized protein n=1 Tax=Zootermopsis nevadensis TaxID=136037 RepID=A0A067RBN7_ZOONE|nr:hypothetical protein L798_10082 [Zootermopsis nevadensis]